MGRKKKKSDRPMKRMGTINSSGGGNPPSPAMTPSDDDDGIINCSGDTPSPPLPMTPADDPILICSLPQSQPDLGLGLRTPAAPSNEVKGSIKPAPPRSVVSKKKSRGVHLRSSDSDEEQQESGLGICNRILPATLVKEKEKDPSVEIGSCCVNPPPAKEKIGPCSANPPPAKDSNEKSENLASCNANPSVNVRSCPPVINNLLDLYSIFSREQDKTIGEMDILEIAAMKGIHFAAPRWHRPGGYDAKPKVSK